MPVDVLVWSTCLSVVRSPGYGLTLVAETTTGVMHAAESSTYSHTATPISEAPALPGRATLTSSGRRWEAEEGVILPEDVGRETASLLIQEIVKVSERLHWPLYS